MKNKLAVIYISLAILLIALIGAGIYIVISGKNNESKIGSLGDKVDDLRNEGEKKEQTIDSLESTKSALEMTKAELEAEVELLWAKIKKLEQEIANSDSAYSDKISELNRQIDVKNAEIAQLEADIARYETVYTIDVREQARLIDELVEYIETKCPYVRMVDSTSIDNKGNETINYKWVLVSELVNEKIEQLRSEFEETKTSSGEKFELTNDEIAQIRADILARDDVYYPNVSVYYEDLATGYHLGYNDDHIYDAASVIKAPYILSVLEVISADEQKYIADLRTEGKQPELVDTDDDGIPETELIEYSDPKYDLSEVVTYKRATMYKAGSGKIQEMEDGTEFSYLDFIKYTLEYSDNVAYNQLRLRFGYDTMYALARRVGAKSILKGGNSMTANDAGKLFKAIANFVETDEKYGKIMAESMQKGNHTVIIPFGVSPKKALHKYGWDKDSYHDAAIVLGDKPYVLAVFSDLDIGGDEVNLYLREIVKKINVLHNNFYK
ncbi:MAG: hypothetical protein HFE63_05930 [Clostridiales bacterium]|nr:hypothetical protein [Clostridiales bacterium]